MYVGVLWDDGGHKGRKCGGNAGYNGWKCGQVKVVMDGYEKMRVATVTTDGQMGEMKVITDMNVGT
jgi:hypothetical protein